MTATYWHVGHIIVEQEQGGQARAGYGDELISQLSADLTESGSILSATTDDLAIIAKAFPLPWSAYVSLLSTKSPEARRFYETEALRNGWTVGQLNRQINSMFYDLHPRPLRFDPQGHITKIAEVCKLSGP